MPMRGLLILLLIILLLSERLLAGPSLDSVSFSGTIKRGETFVQPFGDSLAFALSPLPAGWEIYIRALRRPEDNIARFTPPLHSVPNPREIEGWHFRNASNTGPNDGSVDHNG